MIKPVLKKVAFFAALAGLIMFLEKDTIASGNVKLFSDSYPKSERRQSMERLRKTRVKEVQASLKDKKNEVALNFFLEGKEIKFTSPIIFTFNRYYLPAEEILIKLGYTVEKSQDNMSIVSSSNKVNINFKDKSFNINGEKEYLRGETGLINDKVYMSLFDLCNIGNLTTRWNSKENKIFLYAKKNNQINAINNKRKTNKSNKSALVRFEDLAPMEFYLDDGNLEKLRAVGDKMYENAAPFHVAWVPRYVNPKEGIDNSLLTNKNIKNADFLFTLDYLISKGGIVGLHGYTHQNKEEESIIGSEFSEKYNLSRSEKRERVEKAIEVAQYLNIPYKFFETPHYRCSARFQRLLEQYFDYIYESNLEVYNNKPIVSEYNNRTMYIPTPLGYVKDDNVGEIIDKAEKIKSEDFFSFYYHPGKEFKYITLETSKDGYPSYKYEANKGVQAIINKMHSMGIDFKNIIELRDRVKK